MNLDVEIYMSNVIKFFRENPNDLLNLVSKDREESFYIKIKEAAIKNYEDEKLKSAILDVFDFDVSSMSSEMKKVDWSIELTNPLEDYSFVKKKNKDFIIF